MNDQPPSAQFTEAQLQCLMWIRAMVAASVDTLNFSGVPSALYRVTMEGDVVTLEVQSQLKADFVPPA